MTMRESKINTLMHKGGQEVFFLNEFSWTRVEVPD